MLIHRYLEAYEYNVHVTLVSDKEIVPASWDP